MLRFYEIDVRVELVLIRSRVRKDDSFNILSYDNFLAINTTHVRNSYKTDSSSVCFGRAQVARSSEDQLALS